MILGVTGGIASGKSLISSYLHELGHPVIDADQISRRVVEPESLGLSRLVDRFGSQILNEDASLNRQLLGQLVFSDQDQREEMNAILLPLIRQEIEADLHELKQEGHPLIVLDVPLLYEEGYEAMVDEVMVVAVDPAQQEQRLMDRNQLTQEEARQRIQAQMPLQDKIERADIVIDNRASQEESFAQVDAYLKKKNIG